MSLGPEAKALRKAKKAVRKYLTLVEDDGEPASVTKPIDRNVFRFEDLPPEIRNIIYSYALVADSPVTISHHIDREATRLRRQSLSRAKGWQSYKIRSVYEVRAIVKTETRRKRRVFKFGEAHAPGLLRVNKSIRSEARPLLYALNKFAFHTTPAFNTFYEMSKTVCHLLEYIEFYDIPHGLPLAPFTHARRLRRISIITKHSSTGPKLQNLTVSFFKAIDNLVLECGCKRCAPSDGPPDPRQDRTYCIAKLPAERKKRLQAINIHTSDEQVHLKDLLQLATSESKRDLGTMPKAVYRRAVAVVKGYRSKMSDDATRY